MQLMKTGPLRGQFEVLCTTRAGQAAKMTLQPGAASDSEIQNEHPRSEQWLFIISGSGEAVIGKRHDSLQRVRLTRHSLLLIEKRELHQIRNTGKRPLVAITFYVPPAYTDGGEPK